MAIPDEDVAKVRAATDIAALIGEQTSLKRVGRRLVGLCPFHGEKSPSFSVNAEEGLYYCFGCQASGDAISFVRRIEGLDFVDAVERLAARAGIPIRNDATPEESASRQKRTQLYEAMEQAVDYYHGVLMDAPAAAGARRYLRSRGFDGETVRKFRIGFAPPSWDALVTHVKFPEQVMLEAGLAFRNVRTGRLGDAFRERILFPIFDSGGRAIALGGRVLPEELRTMNGQPGPKYRNSPESTIYQKRSTLYGLNWAKGEITASKEAVICEGYTDVVGFFRGGVPRAVATCGTSLTEEHIRLLSRFCSRVVLCFDQDSAGQNAAARLYEWERRHEIELAVAALPEGADPGDLSRTDPDALRDAVRAARPFLEFRVERAIVAHDLSTPEGRARAAERAVQAIAEHPNELVRDQYLVMLADRTRHSPDQLRALLRAVPPPEATPATRLETPAHVEPPAYDEPEYGDANAAQTASPTGEPDEVRAGRDALRLAIGRPEEVAMWVDEVLFVDPDQRAALRALMASAELHEAIERAPAPAAALIHRLAALGAPDDVDADGTFIELVRAATDRAVTAMQADARRGALAGDIDAVTAAGERIRWLKEEAELLRDPVLLPGRSSAAVDAAHRLLAWLAASAREG